MGYATVPIRQIPIRMIMPWRCTANPDWREYAKLMREGHEFPPVLIERQSSKRYGYPYRLFDGYHRTRAAKHIGRKTIAAHVIVDRR
ncbi:MAG: ParB N-terminal domain-containing protein [Xanthobacteraceae bacterium]